MKPVKSWKSSIGYTEIDEIFSRPCYTNKFKPVTKMIPLERFSDLSLKTTQEKDERKLTLTEPQKQIAQFGECVETIEQKKKAERNKRQNLARKRNCDQENQDWELDLGLDVDMEKL